jgi:hypothetical protein
VLPPMQRILVLQALARLKSGARFAPSGRLIVRLGLVVAFSAAVPAFAQNIDQNLYVTNGTVYAVTYSANTVYIGGIFSKVGPASGGGRLSTFPRARSYRPFPR